MSMMKMTEAGLMRNLIDNIKDNIYFMDREGRIMLINQEGAKWLGYDSPEELIGKTDLDIFTDEHGVAAYEDEQRIMETGIPILGKEEKETRKDGRVTWVSTSKLPLRNDDGEIVGTFGISRDITEHKMADLRAKEFAEENRRFREEMENEMFMAAELQKTFFPTSYPVFPANVLEEDSAVHFSHRHHAGGMVGGDFCSVRKLGDAEVGILLCDVMGHGVRAALGTAIVRAMVEEISDQENDPADFLEHMNRALIPILHQGGQFLFATACYMILDVSSGRLRYAIAGHPVPIKYNTNQSDWLVGEDQVEDPALAISKESRYTTHECFLQPGDSVFMYTDGIYESVNREGEEFGQERLAERVRNDRACSLSELYSSLLDASCTFATDGKLEDDVCLVGFRLNRLLQH